MASKISDFRPISLNVLIFYMFSIAIEHILLTRRGNLIHDSGAPLLKLGAKVGFFM